VFFWKKSPKRENGQLLGSDLAAQIDANRSTQFEKAFNLSISTSPHVVVTRKTPSLDTPASDVVILQLDGLSPSATQKLLGALADQLVGQKLDQETLDGERWRIKWRDIVASVFESLGNILGNSKVTIKGGPVEVEFNSKKQ
jgi:hypothetical protein